MIIAVPVCAIICTVCRNFANRRLENITCRMTMRFTSTMDHIDPETRQAIPYQKRRSTRPKSSTFRLTGCAKRRQKLTTEESPVDAPYTPAKPSTGRENSDSSDSDQNKSYLTKNAFCADCFHSAQKAFALYLLLFRQPCWSVSAGRSTRMICPLTQETAGILFVRFSRITT